ncbi:hypothetical protein A5656_04935 [Mycobacterium gordonae]|nr:hypothetical protein A5656_04935 [Mycobacterium gordonae]
MQAGDSSLLAQRAGQKGLWMTVGEAVGSAVDHWGRIVDVHRGMGAALQFVGFVHRAAHTATVIRV